MDGRLLLSVDIGSTYTKGGLFLLEGEELRPLGREVVPTTVDDLAAASPRSGRPSWPGTPAAPLPPRSRSTVVLGPGRPQDRRGRADPGPDPVGRPHGGHLGRRQGRPGLFLRARRRGPGGTPGRRPGHHAVHRRHGRRQLAVVLHNAGRLAGLALARGHPLRREPQGPGPGRRHPRAAGRSRPPPTSCPRSGRSTSSRPATSSAASSSSASSTARACRASSPRPAASPLPTPLAVFELVRTIARPRPGLGGFRPRRHGRGDDRLLLPYRKPSTAATRSSCAASSSPR